MIYYSAKNNEFYHANLINRIPLPPFVDVTDLYKGYRKLELQGYTRTAGEDGYPIYTLPEVIPNYPEQASRLLSLTDCYELPTYQERYIAPEQRTAFSIWRNALHDVVLDGAELPDTPDFVKALING